MELSASCLCSEDHAALVSAFKRLGDSAEAESGARGASGAAYGLGDATAGGAGGATPQAMAAAAQRPKVRISIRVYRLSLKTREYISVSSFHSSLPSWTMESGL